MNEEMNRRNGKGFSTFLLIAIAVAVFWVFSGFGFQLPSWFGTYKDAEKYNAGDFEYNASDIDEVEIHWVSGKIDIQQQSGGSLSVSESGKDLKKDQQLHWYKKGDRLIIQYCKSGYHGKIKSGEKNLTVEVPEDIALTVDTVSGDVNVDDAREFEKADFDTVSGDVTFRAAECEKVSVDSVSGDVTVGVSSCDKINIDTVSGDATFEKLPENGAVIKLSSVSGKLHTDREYEENKKVYKFGKGDCSIDVDTVSGDVFVS